jgi:hypothetical protein
MEYVKQMLTYSTEVFLFFNIIPEHTDTLLPSWNYLQTIIMAETRGLFK